MTNAPALLLLISIVVAVAFCVWHELTDPD